MTCNHCVNSVTNAISEIKNVSNVDVELNSGEAKISGRNIKIEDVVDAITSSGYSAELVK
jgi:copper chaperone CopZ